MAKGLLSDPALSRSMLLPFGKRTYQDYEDDVSEFDELEFALPSAIADPLGLGGLLAKQALTGQRMNPDDATQAMIDVGMLSTPIGLLGGVPKGAILGANVFQGGPHKYGPEGAAESLKHMSKGEGAQAYGYGRYDAENKAVADDYYNTFNDPDQMPLSFKDKPVDVMWNDGIKERWANEIADMTENQKDDFTMVMGNLSQVKSIEDVPNVLYGFNKEQMAMYKNVIEPDLIKKPTEAYLYKHDLPDEDIARYLDYDAPLSEQPEALAFAQKMMDKDRDIILAKRRADEAVAQGRTEPLSPELNAILQEWSDKFPNDVSPSELAATKVKLRTDEINRLQPLLNLKWGPEKKGSGLYKELQGLLGSDKAASEALAKAGIPGLKYFDGMSRTDVEPHFPIIRESDGAVYQNVSGNRARALAKLRELNELGAGEVSFKLGDMVDNRTRNFVTWDQDVLNRMKLLERNGEKFGGLLSR